MSLLIGDKGFSKDYFQHIGKFESEGIKRYENAYEELFGIIKSDQKAYLEYTRISQSASIMESMIKYMDIVNKMTVQDLNMNSDKLTKMWSMCVSYIPLTLKFSPAVTTKEESKLVKAFENYIIHTCTGYDVDEKLKVELVKEDILRAITFFAMHQVFTHRDTVSIKILNIVMYFKMALNNVVKYREKHTKYFNIFNSAHICH